MRKIKRKYLYFTVNFLIFALLYLFHYSCGNILSIRNATPMLILPMLTAFSMFNDEVSSAVTGLAVGIFMDAAASKAYCFNALVLLCVGLLTSLIARYLFNRNFRSAIVLSLLGNVFYYILRWLFFYAFGSGISSSLTYLLEFGIPSAVYSTVFVIPFFFIQNLYNKKSS